MIWAPHIKKITMGLTFWEKKLNQSGESMLMLLRGNVLVEWMRKAKHVGAFSLFKTHLVLVYSYGKGKKLIEQVYPCMFQLFVARVYNKGRVSPLILYASYSKLLLQVIILLLKWAKHANIRMYGILYQYSPKECVAISIYTQRQEKVYTSQH